MIEESYSNIKTWYDTYVSEFSSEDNEIQINIDLIKEHNSRVLESVRELGLSINLEESDLLILQTAAMLHDIGRFKQLVKHNTYADNDESNHIKIDDPLISRHHAIIEKIGDIYYIRALDSTNSTYVNKNPLKPGEAKKLQPGSVINIGKCEFQII